MCRVGVPMRLSLYECYWQIFYRSTWNTSRTFSAELLCHNSVMHGQKHQASERNFCATSVSFAGLTTIKKSSSLAVILLMPVLSPYPRKLKLPNMSPKHYRGALPYTGYMYNFGFGKCWKFSVRIPWACYSFRITTLFVAQSSGFHWLSQIS